MYLRRMMDKILDRYEEETPITNPKEPIRTSFRKLVYRLSVWRSKLRRRGGRRSSFDRTGDGRR
jgi:hypothetical protein